MQPKFDIQQFVENFNKRYEPFTVQGSPINMSYIVNVDDDFEHPKQFEDIVHILEQASEGDHMRINLTTSGGALHSILPLLGAMDMTSAHVHVHAASDVASAGTFLLMKADSVSMNEYVTVMMHEVSFGSHGNGSRVANHVAYTMESSEKIIRDMYRYFFNEDELQKLLHGSELYMGRDEFIERYERRLELMQEEYEAQQDEHECEGSCQGCSCKSLEDAYDEEPVEYITHLPLTSPEPLLIPVKPSRKRKPQTA